MRVQEDLKFGKSCQYPWDEILDGKPRVLSQTRPAKLNSDGSVASPEVLGDFDVSLESFRNTACSAARERGMKLTTTFLPNGYEIGLKAEKLPPEEAEQVKAKLAAQRKKSAEQAKAKAKAEAEAKAPAAAIPPKVDPKAKKT